MRKTIKTILLGSLLAAGMTSLINLNTSASRYGRCCCCRGGCRGGMRRDATPRCINDPGFAIKHGYRQAEYLKRDREYRCSRCSDARSYYIGEKNKTKKGKS